jgi:phosphopantothenoylcysteine decarboxylase/phosphopantothenate--cysteine ligase
MNTRMWQHPAVQANVKTLVGRGVRIIDPEVGHLAILVGTKVAAKGPC